MLINWICYNVTGNFLEITMIVNVEIINAKVANGNSGISDVGVLGKVGWFVWIAPVIEIEIGCPALQ